MAFGNSFGGGVSGGGVPADGSITAAKLASDAVTTVKILDANVTTPKIADANVVASKLSGAQSGAAPIFGIRAWVTFNGTGTVAIVGSGNVSSITDNGTGDYTVNFTTALPNANYAVFGLSNAISATNAQGVLNFYSASIDGTGAIKTSSACRVLTANGSTGALNDYGIISLSFIG